MAILKCSTIRHVRTTATLVVLAICLEWAQAQRCSSGEAFYIPDGRDYRGVVNTTVSGIPCQKWTSQFPQSHDTKVPDPSLGIGDNNFCRNPFGDTTVGCFTTNPYVRYEHCSIGVPCTASTAARGVTISPNASVVPFGTFVVITCYPQPCDVFYTLDGSIPTKQSTAYQHSFPLYTSTFVRAVALFIDSSVLFASTRFVVSMPRPADAVFLPPGGAYFAPVLVSLAHLDSQSTALIFRDNNSDGVQYVGPFWIATSVTLTAVVNGNQTVTSQYTLSLQSPIPPTLFPSSGSFIGSVRVLVFPLQRLDSLVLSLNNSEFAPLGQMATFSISAIGKTLVHLRAQYIGGLVADTVTDFIVAPPSPAVCQPPPGAFTTAVSISCRDPRGNSARISVGAITVNWAANLNLSSPGSYNVQAWYLDDVGVPVVAPYLYQLVAVPLSTPTVVPCGGVFLLPSLRVSVAFDSNAIGVAPYATNGTVSIAANNDYFISPNAEAGAIVGFVAQGSDPMRSASLPQTCTYAFLSPGNYSTRYQRIVGTISPTDIASCARVGSAASVSVEGPYGPFSLVRFVLLPMQLVPQYAQLLTLCVAQSSPVGEGSFSLVTKYVLNRTRGTVSVIGWNTAASVIKMVDTSLPCDDVGIVLQYLANNGQELRIPSDRSGRFRLCAVTDGYSYAPAGETIEMTALDQTVTALVTPCGGPFLQTVTAVITAGAAVSIDGLPFGVIANLTVTKGGITTAVAAMGAIRQTCVFWMSVPLPSATYDFDGNDAQRVALTATGTFTAPLVLYVSSGGCWNGTELFRSPTFGDSSFIQADSALQLSGNSSSPLSVCLTDGIATVEAQPTSRRLSPLAASATRCDSCPSKYCVPGACGCIDGDLSVSYCTLQLPVQGSFSLLSYLRILLLLVYVVVVVVVVVMLRSHGGSAQ